MEGGCHEFFYHYERYLRVQNIDWLLIRYNWFWKLICRKKLKLSEKKKIEPKKIKTHLQDKIWWVYTSVSHKYEDTPPDCSHSSGSWERVYVSVIMMQMRVWSSKIRRNSRPDILLRDKKSGSLFFIQVQIFQLSEIRLSKEPARAGIHMLCQCHFEIRNCGATFNYVVTATFCTFSHVLVISKLRKWESHNSFLLSWLSLHGFVAGYTHNTRYKSFTFS